MIHKRIALLEKAKEIIDQTYLSPYWQIYNISVEFIDDIFHAEVLPNRKTLCTLEQVLAFGQERSGFSPYFVFYQSQIDELYRIFQDYLATFSHH